MTRHLRLLLRALESRPALVVAVALPAVLLGLHPIDAADVWIHLAAGRELFAHGTLGWTLPGSDAAGTVVSVPNPQWLGGALLYGVHRALGAPGLVSLAALLGMLAVALPVFLGVTDRKRRAAQEAWPWAVSGLLGLGLLYERFFVRPEMVSFLLAAIAAWLLAARPRLGLLGVGGVVLLQAVWANVHPAFVMGPLVALAFAVERTVASMRSQRSGAALRAWGFVALVTAACVATPWGARLLGDAVQAAFTARGEALRAGIVEWQPTFAAGWAHDPIVRLFVVSLAGIVASLAVHRRRLRVADVLVVLGLAVLACTARRYLGYYACIALPVAAAWWVHAGDQTAARTATTRGARGPAPAPSSSTAGVPHLARVAALLPVLAGLLLALDVGRGRFYARYGPPRTLGWSVSARDHPIGAAAFARRQALPGPLFNNVAAGSYLLWDWPQGPRPFVDGRLLDLKAFQTARAFVGAPGRFDSWAAARGTMLVVLALQPYAPVTFMRHLIDAPDWSLVYLDGEGAVFVRRELAAERGLPDVDLSGPLAGVPRLAPARDTFWSRCDPGETWQRGRVLLQLGYPAAARADLANALLSCPDRWEVGLELAEALLQLGQPQAARPLVERALQHDAGRSDAWVARGVCAALEGDMQAAARDWREALQHAPVDPRARTYLDEASRQSPGARPGGP